MQRKSEDTQQSRGYVSLSGEQINSLCIRKRGIQFHLIQGRAWITYDDHDVIVESGETIYVPPSKYNIIISAANRCKSIDYQIA